MRYFFELAYNGSNFVGWQIQENGISVQETLEKAFHTLIRQPVKVIGCGRTDAGVHAKKYFMHVDLDDVLPDSFIYKINRLLPESIVVYRFWEVEDDVHARFSAKSRTYEYHISRYKDPFQSGLSFSFYAAKHLRIDTLQHAANLILEFDTFYPFCKSKSGVDHFKCDLFLSNWQEHDAGYLYTIKANRFLRGMVRLIVGMCLNVGLGKLDLHRIRQSLETQKRFSPTWSVPAQGLFLIDVEY